MDAILGFIAFLLTLHSHLQCKRAFGKCALLDHKPQPKPDISFSAKNLYKEPPVIALIVLVIFITLTQFFATS
ncbi:MAG: hypothetical protein CV087_04730 [Candidatus Brocadia sp. WS118]|nr:MAG: hypothetical protein CV087_04730 [Candidatus Brocadia sp. WS118]